MLNLGRDEFERLRDRALDEPRRPRDTARLIVRASLGLPPPMDSPKPDGEQGPAARPAEQGAANVAT